MATKTFSSRADESALAFADALSRQEYGLSYGQYCGTVLLDSIGQTGRMPELPKRRLASEEKRRAVEFIKNFHTLPVIDPGIDKLSDAEIRNLIASRYE